MTIMCQALRSRLATNAMPARCRSAAANRPVAGQGSTITATTRLPLGALLLVLVLLDLGVRLPAP